MKRIFLFTFALVSLLVGTASAQVEARVHQVFDAHKVDKIATKISDTKYEVNIKETYSTVIIVEIIITLDHATPEIMEDLIKQGRYHLKSETKNGVMTFRVKEDNPPVIIGGKEAEEYVIYNISLPEYLSH